MTDLKEQVAAYVRHIDELHRDIEDHWSQVQKLIIENRLDHAISLLNAYFRLQTKLEQVEGSLKGILGGHFSDR